MIRYQSTTCLFSILLLISCSPNYTDPQKINGDFEYLDDSDIRPLGWYSPNWTKGLSVHKECPVGQCLLSDICGNVGSGSNSLSISSTEETIILLSQRFWVTPSENYSFSFWKQNPYHQILVNINWYDKSNKLIQNNNALSRSMNECQNRIYCGECTDSFYGIIKAPEKSYSAEIELEFTTIYFSENNSYIDNIMIVKIKN